MSRPLISIIIPVYNVGRYVGACLTSVRNQSYGNFECLCVDDGSTDNSVDVIMAATRGDRRFRIFSQKNSGVSIARNVGLGKAKGDWVLFLDGDDQWAIGLLQFIVDCVKAHPKCDAVYFGVELYDERWKSLGRFGEIPLPAMMTGDAILANGRGPYNGCIWSSCDKAYRRSVIEKYGIRFMPGMRLCEDAVFVQTFLAQCGDVYVASDYVGYHYLMRDGSAIHKTIEHLPVQPFKEFEVLYPLWKTLRTPGLLVRLQWLAAGYYSLGKNNIYASDVREKVVFYLARSREFNKVIVPFLLFHGSVKARVFSFVFFISPCWVRRYLLRKIQGN